MSAAWPKVRLGEVLRRSEERCVPTPGAEYREITVRLWGKGVIERGRTNGGSLSGQRFIARVGQFIVSRIDSRNGAMGIVPPTLDGALVTNDFPLFSIDQTRLLRAFMDWLCRTHSFVELCKLASEGTTNRVRLQENRFLALEIALPPLAEQQRIVARIKELASQISESQSFRKRAAEEAEALDRMLSSLFFSESWVEIRLDELCSVITDGTHQTPRYTEEGAIFLSAQNVKPFRFMPDNHRKVSLDDFAAYTAHNKPQQGDVLLTRVGAGIGEAAVVDRDIEFAIYVSLALIRTRNDRLLPDFLVHWLNSAIGRTSSQNETQGKGHSQGNLNLKLLRGMMVPVPTLSEQYRIITELNKYRVAMEALKQLHAETATELEALLPSILDRAFKGEL